jgi:hypothetical protein
MPADMKRKIERERKVSLEYPHDTQHSIEKKNKNKG